MLNISELNDLDFSNIGNWSLPLKVTAVILGCAIILGAGYWFDTQEQIKLHESAQREEQGLKQKFEIKQSKAANLEGYQQQMREIERTFGSLLRQLPSRTEVADLLTDISQTGLSSGLEFELFKPKGEVPIEFYVELPIKLRVRGKYHQLGNFVSGVAGLPRIVTLHEFTITVPKKQGDDNDKGELIMEATAKTYRYFDEKEQEQLSGK